MAVATDPRASVVARDKELSQAFHIALASLDRKYQKVIEVLYFEQLTVEQAAIRLETTEAAVRGLRQRAREKLRDAMVRLSHFI
jgi:RNA polymerase sigma factor (sigma-70 family)